MVTNSRILLRLPMRVSARSPLYFRSCEATPTVRIREENIVLADPGRGLRRYTWAIEPRAGADLDVRADDAVGSDLGGSGNARARIDNGGRMNRHPADCRPSRLFVGQLAHDFGLGDHHAVHRGLAAILATDRLALDDVISMRS